MLCLKQCNPVCISVECAIPSTCLQSTTAADKWKAKHSNKRNKARKSPAELDLLGAVINLGKLVLLFVCLFLQLVLKLFLQQSRRTAGLYMEPTLPLIGLLIVET